VACRHCGAVLAILTAQCCLGPTHEECWISMRRKNKLASVEFRAKATPLRIEDTDTVVMALQDISDQKRRLVLESTFLHDARNLLSGILSWSDVLRQENPDEAAVSIGTLTRQLRDLLSEHASLAQAEKGELVVQKVPIDLQDLARTLNERFSGHPSGEGKTLAVWFPEGASPLHSDQSLVSRILSNMVTNALEASKPGSKVAVRFERKAGTSTFTVHNPGVIPEEVVPRIFQRSFSTKTEPGHGLGTYSMRLFAEQYLGGNVTFESSIESGTSFCLTLPDG
jgi:signal transduction histidine kinase